MLALLCALLVRVGGAHLHLCFDGTEPPASIHLYDISEHHDEPGMDVSHDDLDVALGGEFVSKSGWSEQDQSLLFLVAAMFFVILLRFRLRSVLSLRRPVVAALFHLRPLLRGPPRSISC